VNRSKRERGQPHRCARDRERRGSGSSRFTLLTVRGNGQLDASIVAASVVAASTVPHSPTSPSKRRIRFLKRFRAGKVTVKTVKRVTRPILSIKAKQWQMSEFPM
jgi:hypothetical protein